MQRSIYFQAHKVKIQCINEIPIYLCSLEDHNRYFDKEQSKHTSNLKEGSEVYNFSLYYFAKNVWFPRDFNQVIGWLRIYGIPKYNEFTPPFILGEYYKMQAKRFNKGLKKKRILFDSEAFFFEVDTERTSENILKLINQEINVWWIKAKSKKWILDTDAFNNIGNFVNWKSILNLDNQ